METASPEFLYAFLRSFSYLSHGKSDCILARVKTALRISCQGTRHCYLQASISPSVARNDSLVGYSRLRTRMRNRHCAFLHQIDDNTWCCFASVRNSNQDTSTVSKHQSGRQPVSLRSLLTIQKGHGMSLLRASLPALRAHLSARTLRVSRPMAAAASGPRQDTVAVYVTVGSRDEGVQALRAAREVCACLLGAPPSAGACGRSLACAPAQARQL